MGRATSSMIALIVGVSCLGACCLFDYKPTEAINPQELLAQRGRLAAAKKPPQPQQQQQQQQVDIQPKQPKQQQQQQAEGCSLALIESLAASCSDQFDKQVSNLAEFRRFHGTFEQFSAKCLVRHQRQPPTKTRATDTLSEASYELESKCEAHGLALSQIRQLARLIGRYLGAGREPHKRASRNRCTIEYAMKLYRFQERLRAGNVYAAQRLARIFNQLANLVYLDCRLSLGARIRDVERRAPDTLKYNQLLVALTNLHMEPDELDQMLGASLPADSFQPILEHELLGQQESYATHDSHDDSYDDDDDDADDESGPPETSLGLNGYSFKLNQAIRLSVDSIRMSCRAMKLYQVNLLGPLGLLASLGFDGNGASEQLIDYVAAAADELSRGQLSAPSLGRWLLGSMLCQSQRTVLKVAHQVRAAPGDAQEAGKLVARSGLQVSASQEADVGREDELDASFGQFQLPERHESQLIGSILGELAGFPAPPPPSSDPATSDSEASSRQQLIASLRSAIVGRAREPVASNRTAGFSARKWRLIMGPSFRLASAIVQYLDLSQSAARLAAIEQIAGTKLVAGATANSDDDDDDVDEREEDDL